MSTRESTITLLREAMNESCSRCPQEYRSQEDCSRCKQPPARIYDTLLAPVINRFIQEEHDAEVARWEVVQRMRGYQKMYFRNGSKDELKNAKHYETKVDEILADKQKNKQSRLV